MGKLIKAIVVVFAVLLLVYVGWANLAWYGKLIVVAAVNIVADAFAPKAPEVRQGGLKEEVRSPVATRRIVYGRVRAAGTMVAAFTTGTDNKYMHFVMVMAAHEIDSYEKFFVGEDEVTLDGSDLVVAGKYAGLIRITTHVGTAAQAADTNLVSEVGAWTADHKLSGLAYIVVRWEFDREKYTSGRPVITVLMKGAKILDTRTALTAWSDNIALIAYDYLTIGGGSAWDIGCRIPTAEIDTDAVDAAANECEEAVTLKAGGTHDRYSGGGALAATTVRETNLRAILSSMAGQLIYQAGGFHLYAAAAPTAAVAFDDDDLRGPFQLDTKQPMTHRVNRVIGVFLDSTGDVYEENNYPPMLNSTYVTEDDGYVYEKRLDLPFTQHPERAQRIASIELERRRRQMVGRYSVKLKGLQVQCWSTITVTSTKYSFVAKEFQILKWSFSRDGGVDMEIREHDSGIYAWTAATDATTPQVSENPSIDDQSTGPAAAGLSIAAVTITKNSTKIPVLVATWTAPSLMVALTEIQWQRDGESLWEPGPAIPDPQNARATLDAFLPDEVIDIRVRHQSTFGVFGAWDTVTGSTLDGTWVLSGSAAGTMIGMRLNAVDMTGSANPAEAFLYGFDGAGVPDATIAPSFMIPHEASTASENSVFTMGGVTQAYTWVHTHADTGSTGVRDGFVVYETAETAPYLINTVQTNVFFAWLDTDGQWYYDNNSADVTFTPTATMFAIGTVRRSTSAGDLVSGSIWQEGRSLNGIAQLNATVGATSATDLFEADGSLLSDIDIITVDGVAADTALVDGVAAATVAAGAALGGSSVQSLTGITISASGVLSGAGGGTVVIGSLSGSSAYINSGISISSAGVLSGAGGGTVSIGSLAGSSAYLNTQITVSADGTLNNAGGGQVDLATLGYSGMQNWAGVRGILNINSDSTVTNNNPGEAFLYSYDDDGNADGTAHPTIMLPQPYGLTTLIDTGNNRDQTIYTGGATSRGTTGFIVYDAAGTKPFTTLSGTTNLVYAWREDDGTWKYENNGGATTMPTITTAMFAIGTLTLTLATAEPNNYMLGGSLWGFGIQINHLAPGQADVTSANTAADTTLVSGTAAAIVEAGAVAANDATFAPTGLAVNWVWDGTYKSPTASTQDVDVIFTDIAGDATGGTTTIRFTYNDDDHISAAESGSNGNTTVSVAGGSNGDGYATVTVTHTASGVEAYVYGTIFTTGGSGGK